jgi:hypothetical protein
MLIETKTPACAGAASRLSIGTTSKAATNSLRILERRDIVTSPFVVGPKSINISPSARTIWAYLLKPRSVIVVAN